jgi:hypothetical protein
LVLNVDYDGACRLLAKLFIDALLHARRGDPADQEWLETRGWEVIQLLEIDIAPDDYRKFLCEGFPGEHLLMEDKRRMSKKPR